MKIAITGASGLVGTALQASLKSFGHTVVPFSRQPSANGAIYWNPAQNEIESEKLEGVDAVVHLAGENIADGRWNEAKKKRIRNSRVSGTTLISQSIAQLKRPPKVFISASAIGFYGDRGSELMEETSTPGHGFLPDTCQAWEGSTDAMDNANVRLVHLRIGVVLTPKGGALSKMLLPFKMGAGGKVGSGQQYMSWVSLDDVVGIIRYCIETEGIKGPVNAVAPEPVTNLEFTKTLGRVLSRPTIAPLPAFMAKLIMGEMAQDLLLASTRVIPTKLHKSGYTFQHPQLEGALRSLLHS